MLYSTDSLFYDSPDFDAQRNAIEAGVESVPVWYAESMGGFGDTPPNISVSRGDTIYQGSATSGLVLGGLALLLVYFLCR